MPDNKLIEVIKTHIGRQSHISSAYPSHIDGLFAIYSKHSTTLETTLYEPIVCLILQGRKETWLGDRCFNFGAGESLIVSHHLPVVSRITEASPEIPYVALVMNIDMHIIRNLYEELSEAELNRGSAISIDSGKSDIDLIQAMGRLFKLEKDSIEAKIMTPLIRREIHFRLLLANHGGMLRQLLHHDSAASRITKAINKIRKEFKSPISVPDLAGVAGMSLSTFHEHFKELTQTSPLQYQKNLRLIEARRLLMEGARSISTIAFDVGYQSPTQFSREYARKFSASPRDDLASGQNTNQQPNSLS